MSANWTAGAGVILGALAFLVSGLALLRAHFKGAQGEASALGALETRVESLESRADRMDNLMSEVTAKVALLPVIEEKLKGLDNLVTVRLNSVDTALGRMETKLERLGEGRSFKPTSA